MDFAARLSDLLRPEAYPHPARDVRMLETHISWIFLAGDHAYKLRKPVNFGFLDFSTVGQRRLDCNAEITLNRRLCPDLYLGVIDVVEGDDGLLRMGGFGKVLEPAVMMRRLPESGMLSVLLERGEADERLMQRIALRLADFHASAPTGSGVDEYGSVQTLLGNWEENFRQTQTALVDAEKRDATRRYVERFVSEYHEVFERRMHTGRIRDGHGDLHASSVCSTRRGLYLFDCIQFNRRFRCADVAADLAFLSMDLEHFGRGDLAATLVDAYVRHSHDNELLLLLDFYKCYRAYVRGKVLSFRLDEVRLDSASAATIAAEARAYFDLAYAYAEPFTAPLLIVTMGLPASGKTTLARGLAGRLGGIHLSSDVARKHLMGLRPNVHRLDPFEGGIYARTVSRRTYATLRKQAARWLRRGKTVVIDATYGQPSERAALRHLARRVGARPYFILCHADEELLKSRLVARIGDPHTTSDARLEIWPALRAAFVEPVDVPLAFCADTSQSVDTLLVQILADLERTQRGSISRRAA